MFEDLKAKLDLLRQLDKNCAVFGACQHQYKFGQTLSEAEVNRIEEENNIHLSQEYKDLLIHFGNGGPGAGYGLMPLSLKHIQPPYPGSDYLLRNWPDPEELDFEMIDLDEITGYIKLFDFGCGMETCLIVSGKEVGELFWYDCDEHFRSLGQQSIVSIIETWLDTELVQLQRVKEKLERLPLQEAIDSEWELQNFSVKDQMLSIMGASLDGPRSGASIQRQLESTYHNWKSEKKPTLAKIVLNKINQLFGRS